MSGFPWDHSLTHSPRSFTFPNIQLPVVRCYHLMWRHYGSYLSLDLPAVHTGFGYTEPITGITWVWTCLLLTIQSFDFTKLITGLNWVLLCPLSIQGIGYTEVITDFTWRCRNMGLIIRKTLRVLPDAVHTRVWLYRCHHGSYLTPSIQGLIIQSLSRILSTCRSACCWPYRAFFVGFDLTKLIADLNWVLVCPLSIHVFGDTEVITEVLPDIQGLVIHMALRVLSGIQGLIIQRSMWILPDAQRFGYTEVITGLTWHIVVWLYIRHYGSYTSVGYTQVKEGLTWPCPYIGLVIQRALRVLP